MHATLRAGTMNATQMSSRPSRLIYILNSQMTRVVPQVEQSQLIADSYQAPTRMLKLPTNDDYL